MEEKDKGTPNNSQSNSCSSSQCSCKRTSQSTAKFMVGIALVVIGVLLVIACFSELMALIRGCLGIFLILAGAITIAIAKE